MMKTRINDGCIPVIAMILLCCISGPASRAQVVTARVLPDTTQALIGDQFGLQLIIEKPEDVDVTFPEFGEGITDRVVVTSRSDMDTTFMPDGREQLLQRLTIAVFDTGRVEVPPLAFRFQSGPFSDTIMTLPFTIDILALQLDEDIRDIKANDKAPVTLIEIAPYMLGILLILLILWLIRRYYLKKYGRLQVSMATANLDPPDVTAIRELEKLRNEAPWKHNSINPYYIRLSEVLRYYVEQQFRVPALEQTTSEILLSVGKHHGQPENLRMLDQILTLSDLVKFARVVPDSHENALQVDLAIEYVKATGAVLRGSDKGSGDPNQDSMGPDHATRNGDPGDRDPDRGSLKKHPETVN